MKKHVEESAKAGSNTSSSSLYVIIMVETPDDGGYFNNIFICEYDLMEKFIAGN